LRTQDFESLLALIIYPHVHYMAWVGFSEPTVPLNRNFIGTSFVEIWERDIEWSWQIILVTATLSQQHQLPRPGPISGDESVEIHPRC